jgi:tRNA(Phe) wybutosine-synthesizing methylase Tyw3
LHKQVWVKVNTPVDEGIAELVCLLNQIDRLYTLDSCQGYNGRGSIYFRYTNWQKLGRFVFGTLAPALHDIEGITLCAEAIDGNEPMANLGFRTKTIPQIVSALKLVPSFHKL